MTRKRYNRILAIENRGLSISSHCVYEVCDIIEGAQIVGMSRTAVENAFNKGYINGRKNKNGRIYLSIASLLNHYPLKVSVTDVLG